MLEYAGVLQTNFIENFHTGMDSIVRWLSEIPVYWIILALVGILLMIKALTSRKHYKK